MDYLLNIIGILYLVRVARNVLNLIINGLPSKLYLMRMKSVRLITVLNLIINGLPSKLKYLRN